MIDPNKVILTSEMPAFSFSKSGSYAWSVGGTISDTLQTVNLLPAGGVDTDNQMVLVFWTNQNLAGNPAYTRVPISDVINVTFGGSPDIAEIFIAYEVTSDGSLNLKWALNTPPGSVPVSGAAKQYKIVYYVFNMPPQS